MRYPDFRRVRPPLVLLSCWILVLALAAGCERAKKTDGPGQPAQKSAVPAGEKAGEVTAILAVEELKGPAVAVKAGGGQWATLQVGQALPSGAALRTRKGARTRLALDGGRVVLHVNEETQLSMPARDRLELTSGSLLCEVEPRDGAAALVIDTPAGAVKVTGTKLHLKVEQDATTVDVTRGSVELDGAGARLDLGAGERAVMRKGQGPKAGPGADLAFLTRWARELTPPSEQTSELRPGFGSLTARAPGQPGSRPLALASHKVRVTVQDNVALTEIEQSYYNPTSQTLEGTYRFPLPAGASISRLALYVGDRLEEGEIVERKRAQQIFRQIVEDTIRPRDPALLEWVGGRTFQMKIFPIPPRAARRVILAYTEVLEASSGRRRYVYPMTSDPARSNQIGKFSLEMKIGAAAGPGQVTTPLYPVTRETTEAGQLRLRYEASHFKPAASFVAEMTPAAEPPELQLALFESSAASQGACALAAIRSSRAAALPASCGDKGGFFMAVLRPELPSAQRAAPRDHLFVLDSSYNTGKQAWALQGAALEAFLGEMDSRSRFNVMACDAACKVMAEAPQRPDAESRRRAVAFVQGITPGGSSDIQGAFEQAAALAAAQGKGVRVIYMGDGRPSAGELREPQLARLVVEQLRRVGASLDVLQVGDDAATLFLAEATRKLSGAVHPLGTGDDLGSRVFELVAASYRPTLTDLSLSFEGDVDVHHVYPGQLPSLTAGSEVVVVGRYGRGGKAQLTLKGLVGERSFSRTYPLDLAASESERRANAFIPRLWARHHLDALTAESYDGNRPEIVRVSQAYTVLSRATAFLVLENERMYREFGVTRNRNRNYWKGDSVASKGVKDQAPAGASAENKALGGLSGGKGGEAAGGGAASAGDSAREASEPAAPLEAQEEAAPATATEQPPADKRASSSSAPLRGRRAGGQDLDDLSSGARSGDMALDAEDGEGDGAEARGSSPWAQPPPKAKKAPMARPSLSSADEKMRPLAAGPAKPAASSAPEPPPMPERASRRRPYSYFYRMHQVRSASITPLLTVPVSAAAQAAEDRYRGLVASEPLRRAHRAALHRRLMLDGQYAEALTQAGKWAELDSDSNQALRALAEVQAARGEASAALRTFASAVEVHPYSVPLHRAMSEHYRNKGLARQACAHLWSLVSIRPSSLGYNLELVRCLAPLPDGKDMALRVLADLSADPRAGRQAAAIGRALRELQDGTLAAAARSASPRTSGAIVVSGTWSGPDGTDLDLALVTPRGQRISALSSVGSGSVEADSRDGRSAEVLRLGSARDGAYRVEVTRMTAGDSSGRPITGTIIVKAHGTTRTIPFVMSEGSKPLALVTLTTRRLPMRY